MKILCVEDGSVDLEAIEQEGLKDGGILVYRQGSQPPYVLEVGKAPIKYITKEQWDKLKEVVWGDVCYSRFVQKIWNFMMEIEGGEV